ncbi:glutathione S-transferase family protein [Glaciimonas sp. CA11.2]|uniref:glutathione S-transferase family protein n=1 Tax=Glaciimonas sp. CA11.2 TaxID=3048601 RepID=UPI002AB49DB4|nr:glutathione S-transferase family protein [Glaciimonas sp. CA11.2]MDY7545118.1 glutathione S-transferase family protein [Glaciimonas sp. CA11.2]MEB0162835.1 glutathione S-transferase family protein [Glaciimonas sp. CA11.2]
MITLYHCMSARSFRPLWMLEELGIPYELKMLPFPPRVLARPFLAINPLGTVPAFSDDATQMTESTAICQYLAARFSPKSLNVEIDEPDFGAYLNYLHFGEATLTFPQTLVLRYGRFESPDRLLPQAVEDYTKWFLARLRTLETLLAQQKFLCAGRFTAADVSVGYALLLAEHLDLSQRFTPSVLAYWERLRSRIGFQRAIQAQERAAIDQDVSLIPAPDVLPP